MNKLSLSLIIIVVCAIFALGWAIDQFFENYSEENTSDVVSHYKALGKQLAITIDELDDIQTFVKKWNANGTNRVSVIAKQQFPIPPELQHDFYAGKALVLNNGNALSFHYYLVKKQSILTFSPDELVGNSNHSKLSLLLTAFFYFGIVAIISLWLFPLVNRLNQLTKTAVRFGSGQLDQRVSQSRTSYIGDLETEFNRMADKIGSLIADNKLISSAVSHDLKTPLARLRLGLDVIEENQDQQVQQKYVVRLSKDIDEMQTLITVLIDYARLEQALVKISKNPIHLDQLLNQLKQDYSEQGNNFELRVDSTSTSIVGDENYLKMLFHNLLNNGFSHYKNKIMVELLEHKNKLLVRIHDDGKGIEKSKRKELLKPFIKQDSSGHGLGLAIAERIAHWHQAELIIRDSELLGGAMLEVRFFQPSKV